MASGPWGQHLGPVWPMELGRCAGAGLRALLQGRSSGLLPTALSLRFSSVGIQGRAQRDRGAARAGWQQVWGRSSSQCSCGKERAEGAALAAARDAQGMRGAPRRGGERGWQGPHGGEAWDKHPAKCRVGHGEKSPLSAGSGGVSASPQAQPGRLREHRGIRSRPYLSLPRGGLGSVEHLLPALHARHGLHVLAPVPDFHRAFLWEGQGWGTRGWQPWPVPPPGGHSHPLTRSLSLCCCPCMSSWLGRWQTAS